MRKLHLIYAAWLAVLVATPALAQPTGCPTPGETTVASSIGARPLLHENPVAACPPPRVVSLTEGALCLALLGCMIVTGRQAAGRTARTVYS